MMHPLELVHTCVEGVKSVFVNPDPFTIFLGVLIAGAACICLAVSAMVRNSGL